MVVLDSSRELTQPQPFSGFSEQRAELRASFDEQLVENEQLLEQERASMMEIEQVFFTYRLLLRVAFINIFFSCT